MVLLLHRYLDLLSCVLFFPNGRSFTLSFHHVHVVRERQATFLSSLQNVFTEEVSAALAEQVQKTVELPFVPGPVVAFVLTQAIQNLSSDLTPDTLQKVQDLLGAESTESTFDDVPEEDRNRLADQVASELNSKIDVPMFDEHQQSEVLKQIMRVVFSVMTTSESEARSALIRQNLLLSRDILGTKESRASLVKAINEAVNLPILGETAEAALLQSAVDMCAKTLQALLPPELIETLKGESSDGLLRMKEYLIEEVNKRVDLVGLSEDQEKVLIKSLVDILIDQFVDGTEAEFWLLTKEEQVEKLQERRDILNHEIELSNKRHEREQQNIAAQLERVDMRLQTLPKQKSL